MLRIAAVDSHTEGEPTRVIIGGGPDLVRMCAALGLTPTVANQRLLFASHADEFRAAVINEPRGHDVLVGALIVPALAPGASCGVIFFNNVGVLNGCGHGTIGLARTMARLGRWRPGVHLVETPVGVLDVDVSAGPLVSIRNVESYRTARAVPLDVSWEGRQRRIHGDIAWGGNWFFLCDDHGFLVHPSRLGELTSFSLAVRDALERAGLRGHHPLIDSHDPHHADDALSDDAQSRPDPRGPIPSPNPSAHPVPGGVIDHIELFGPPSRPDCHSKNFVLCPGGAYDRSPCGTGTSAKLACLVADGKLPLSNVPGTSEGEWRQESIIGSAFSAWAAPGRQGGIIPTIRGGAWITGELSLLIDSSDPFASGIRLDTAAVRHTRLDPLERPRGPGLLPSERLA